MKTRTSLACMLITACIFHADARPALAQSEADFVNAFSGAWTVFDEFYGTAERCTLTLGTTKTVDFYPVLSEGCTEALAPIARWKIAENQLLFSDANGAPVARLGGNQRRISGETAKGAGVIMERTVSASGGNECVYRGYTGECASPQDQRKPLPTGDLSKQAPVRALVKLNMRIEPRPDAEIVTEIAPDACLRVNQCVSASDGNWCKASFNETSGWITQQAMRKGQWKTLTYVPDC